VITADVIWMNGEYVAWDEARVHVLTHALHYGTGVFDSMRAYETERGTAIFRNVDHLERLRRSAAYYRMDLPYTVEELREVTHELINRNGFKGCYLRPIAYRAFGPMGLYPLDNPVDVSIAAWEWGAYLGDEGKREGIRVRTSSWRRMGQDAFIPQAKACGQYLNSVLAKLEAADAGVDEAIMLDRRDFVCEGSGENVFVVRDGRISTPPLTASILDGINRRSIMAIAADLGSPVVERDVARAELLDADELFLTGTAAELTPIREIDGRELGPPGPVTREIAAVFDDALHGRDARYEQWLDFVPVASTA
jgi:branched-chain amino acid aminotransferase